MDRISRLRRFLEGIFTRQERAALGFLIGVSLLGLAVIGWRRAFPPGPAPFVELSVQVNRAGAAELAALPGIGPKLAQRIAEDRRNHGYFVTLEDLKRVKGVTPKTLEKLKGLVRFD